MPDIDEDEKEKKINPALQAALEKRDKLLEYDKIGGHSIIKDQQSDWYELEHDTWQSKEQREFARKIREYEEKRIIDEEDAVFLNIGGEGKDFVGVSKGKATKTQDQINQEANQYIQELAADRVKQGIKEDELIDIKDGFKNITIKSCEYLDEKSQELLKKLKEDTVKRDRENERRRKKKEVYADFEKEKVDPTPMAMDFLSERLQSENPFEHFQKELEKALKKKEAEQKALEDKEMEDDIDKK